MMDKEETIKELRDGLNRGERKLKEYLAGMSGGFYTSLFDAAFKADSVNLSRLGEGFLEEAKAVYRYKNEPGYANSLESKGW